MSYFISLDGKFDSQIKYIISKNVFLDREDIFNSLVKEYLIDKETAFEIMEDVRKGKGVKEKYINLLSNSKVPDYLIKTMSGIRYMSSKGDYISRVIDLLKIAFIKIKHPVAFYNSIMFTHKLDICKYNCLSNSELLTEVSKYKKLTEEYESIYLLLEARERNIDYDLNKSKFVALEN